VKPPRYLAAMDRLNPLVVAILRSPLHGLLSPGLMAITITGRRTGRRYTIPVGYHRLHDAIVVLVSNAQNRSWWRNFREAGEVELRVRGRALRGTALVLRPDDPEFKRRAEQSFRRARFIPRLFEIDFDSGKGLSDDQVRQLGSYAAIVRITPEEMPCP
jgi:deazaflavin-dependent oxidoreductase (nitroreductase family)